MPEVQMKNATIHQTKNRMKLGKYDTSVTLPPTSLLLILITME